ncbi:hypothetical protein DERF_008762 [Dermatophagoides farinae]|uniref:Uncharacterized protein n=1 Tax=Dermatophagoides farinae TaxID=6954 RepID=A0A922L799_DERFA|nr:hypothetical protein DERF_008741 [Dermatophagoides farinae]KAH9518166.1 hypothetical protein DERF_008762 [Dermatophagoides farinae]
MNKPGTGASRLPQAGPAGLTPDSQYSWIPAGVAAVPPPLLGIQSKVSILDGQYSWIQVGNSGFGNYFGPYSFPPTWHPVKGVNFNASCLTVGFYARRVASGLRFGTAGSAITCALHLIPLKKLRTPNSIIIIANR